MRIAPRLTHMLEVKLGLLSDGGIRVERRLDPVPQAGYVHLCGCGREARMVCRSELRVGDGRGRRGVDRALLLLSCAHKQQYRVRIGGGDRGRFQARVRISLILRLVGLVQLVRDVMVRGSSWLFLCGPGHGFPSQQR
jgi:hypothetical protein